MHPKSFHKTLFLSWATASSYSRLSHPLRIGLTTALVALGSVLAQAGNPYPDDNTPIYNNNSSTTSNDAQSTTTTSNNTQSNSNSNTDSNAQTSNNSVQPNNSQTSTDNTVQPTPTPTTNTEPTVTNNETVPVTPTPTPTTNTEPTVTNNEPVPVTPTPTPTTNTEPTVPNNDPVPVTPTPTTNNDAPVQNNDNQVIVNPEPDHKQDMANAGLTIAQSQGQQVISTIQGALNDVNGRLFNLRAGGGEVTPDTIASSIASSIDDGVIVGQGDGPEKGPVAKRVLRAYQWQVYSTVNYANINQSQINTQAGVRSTSWTPGIGIERHLTPNIALGFAASLIETHQVYSGGLGKLDIQGVALSTYASYVRGPFWTDLLYSFGVLDLDSSRNPGFALPTATGNTTAYTNSVQFNTGWNFRFQNNTLVTGPFVGVDYMHASVDGYTESGGGLGALAYGRRSYDSLISRVGWAVSKSIDTGAVKITPQLRVAFERQNITNNNGTSVNLINQSFTATATNQAPGQEYMMAGAGVNFQFSDRFNMLLTYQGQFFRRDQQAHYGGVRLSWKF